jgi:Tfp pilus assembly protein PilX
MTGRIRLQRLADERGQSLVMALLVLTFLAVSLGTVIFFTASNQRSSNLHKAQATAKSLAEAGVNNAISVLANPNNAPYLENEWAADGSGLSPLPDGTVNHPAYSTRYSGGVATSGCVSNVPCVKWWGNLDTTYDVWTLHGKATVPNPTGAAAIVKTMSAQVQVNAPNPTNFKVGVWNTVYSPKGPTAGQCDTSIGQGITISIPVYVGGNLCMGQNAVITKPVYVGGFLTFQNKQGHIGSSGNGNTVNSAHVGGYCQVSSGTQVSPCKSEPVGGSNPNTNIWVTGAPTNLTGVASDFIGITAPAICWDGTQAACTGPPLNGWYAVSSPGPTHPCVTSSGTPPTYDNDSSFNNSVATTFNLTPATSYTCKTAQGELSYNAATRVLTIAGTVFIDGNVTASTPGNLPIQYTGWGSGGNCTNNGDCQSVLYVSGDFSLNSEKLCAVMNASNTDCNWTTNAWDPNKKILIVASNGSTGITVGPSQTSFQGGLYATNTVSTGQSAVTEGPLVSGTQAVVLGQQFGGTFPAITILPLSIQTSPGGFFISPPFNFKYGG